MDRLRDLLTRARARAGQLDHPVLASLTETIAPMDPLDVMATPHASMFWAHPAARFAIAALGSAHTFPPGPGADRFDFARDRWSALRRDALIEGDLSGAGTGPLFMGGFAFDPERPISATWRGFEHGGLVLPRLSVTRAGERHALTLNALVSGTTAVDALAAELEGVRARALSPRVRWPMEVRRSAVEMKVPVGREQWRALVRRAVSAIEARRLEKVVLAREQFGEVIGFDVLDALRFLVDEHPTTFVFAVWREDAVFFGATPERLVRVDGREVRTSVLAGSAERDPLDASPENARRALEQNAKDRVEHDIVRRDIESQLGADCEDIRVGTAEVIALRQLLHLHTPVTARLRDRRSIFDVLERLHPTPAVGGAPRDAALRFIREQEGLDRGWYAGPVGWAGTEAGEFAVALRCALVRNELAHTFAGCGIVEQSDPDAEWEESSLKMRTATEALSAGIAGMPRPLSFADPIR